MYLDAKKKKTLFKKYGKSELDTGNSESQIAVFTQRINHLTEYLKENKKDNNTKRSLVLLVGKRRRMLEYLKQKTSSDIEKLFKR